MMSSCHHNAHRNLCRECIAKRRAYYGDYIRLRNQRRYARHSWRLRPTELLQRGWEWQETELPQPPQGLNIMEIIQISQICLSVPDEWNCSICLSHSLVSDWARSVQCGHIFHDDCIMTWFREHTTCPLCRFQCR
jgi:hypothetical protein